MREKGKCLADQNPRSKFVEIYRAVLETVNDFKPMDYITLSKKWAIEHCQHLVATEEEPAHVMYAMVHVRNVFDAYNPGEYFYDGPAIPLTKVVYHLTPDELENLDESRGQVDENTKKRIYDRITTTGIIVNRGERPKRGREFASDPGDFGRGIYYSTNHARAKVYGHVQKKLLKFENPLVVTDDEAYNLSDRFHTVRLPKEFFTTNLVGKYDSENFRKVFDKELLKNAQTMTEYMLSKGYDGLVSIRTGGRSELEIVDYRPYRRD